MLTHAQYLRLKNSNIVQDTIYSITGLDPTNISLCKMLWMKENHPNIYDKSVKWLQMTDYIIYKLTGTVATDYTLASRTLAFDVVKNVWSNEILDAVGVDKGLLPDIVESGTVVGKVLQSVSEDTGLSTSIPVVMGGNDHPCAALPAGVLNGNKILDSSGTAESIILISKPNQKPNMVFEGQRTCRFLDKSRLALWGGIISSGASFEWTYRTLVSSKEWDVKQDEYDYKFILDQVKDIPAGANGLLFYLICEEAELHIGIQDERFIPWVKDNYNPKGYDEISYGGIKLCCENDSYHA